MVRVPQLQRVLQQRFQPLPEVARPAGLGRQHVADRPLDMRQAFLLADVVEGLGIVAAPPVRDHHAGIVRRNDLLDFLVAMAGPDLIDGRRIGLERHQVGGLAPDPPAGVIGVHHRGLRDRRPQLRVGRAHRACGAPQGILGEGPLRQLHPSQAAKTAGTLRTGMPTP